MWNGFDNRLTVCMKPKINRMLIVRRAAKWRCHSEVIQLMSDLILQWPSFGRGATCFSKRLSSVLVVNGLTVSWLTWRMWEITWLRSALLCCARLRVRQQVHKYLVRFLVFVLWRLLTQWCLVANSYFLDNYTHGRNLWFRFYVIIEQNIWRESLKIKMFFLSCMWRSYSLTLTHARKAWHDTALKA